MTRVAAGVGSGTGGICLATSTPGLRLEISFRAI